MKSIIRFFASTKNGLYWLLLGAGIALLLWGLRMPGGDIPYLITGAALVTSGMLFVINRIVTRLVLKLKGQTGMPNVSKGWKSWILGTVAIIILGMAGSLGLPFRLAFFASRPQLDSVVESYAKGQLPVGHFWAGILPMSSVNPIEGGLEFTFRKKEFPWGRRGIYYSISGKPIDKSSFYSQKRIGSNWFSWHYGGW